MDELIVYIENFLYADWVKTTLTALFILIITGVVASLVKRFLDRFLAYGEEKGLPSSSIFINIARATVWILGVCTMLDTCFGVNISAVIAALGIGGIAISLGFQDTISNLIGGFQVSLMRIVVPGDNIMVGTSKGVVEDITWRHTAIRNSAGQRIIIPNSTINSTALVHLPPVTKVSIPLVVVAGDASLEEVSESIVQAASGAVQSMGELDGAVTVLFSSVDGMGFTGTVSFNVVDGSTSGRAADAVIRAIAPFTRGSKK